MGYSLTNLLPQDKILLEMNEQDQFLPEGKYISNTGYISCYDCRRATSL